MHIKKEIRVVGIDDSHFKKFSHKDVLVVGAVYRGGSFMDGVMTTRVRTDGRNATERLIAMINRSRYKPQLQAIFLNGIALAGFNVIDIHSLNRETGIPVIVVVRKKPDIENISAILRRIGMAKKARFLERAGTPIKTNNVYVQFAGTRLEIVKRLLDITCTHSSIPEPIRIAHIIGQGIVLGESKGKS